MNAKDSAKQLESLRETIAQSNLSIQEVRSLIGELQAKLAKYEQAKETPLGESLGFPKSFSE